MSARLTHFLLVEDDDDHAELISITLARNQVGHTFERVRDGEEALAYVRQEGAFADKPRPGLMLLDLKLPKIDGHQVLEQIKSDDTLRRIPVVMFTTSRAETDKARAYDNGANSYLVKPVDFEKFQEVVENLRRYWGEWNQP